MVRPTSSQPSFIFSPTPVMIAINKNALKINQGTIKWLSNRPTIPMTPQMAVVTKAADAETVVLFFFFWETAWK